MHVLVITLVQVGFVIAFAIVLSALAWGLRRGLEWVFSRVTDAFDRGPLALPVFIWGLILLVLGLIIAALILAAVYAHLPPEASA